MSSVLTFKSHSHNISTIDKVVVVVIIIDPVNIVPQ